MLLLIQSIENVVKLVLPADESAEPGSPTHTTFSLSQLTDLQSKLMLVAGKATQGKEQVDRFVEVRVHFIVFKVFYCHKLIII